MARPTFRIARALALISLAVLATQASAQRGGGGGGGGRGGGHAAGGARGGAHAGGGGARTHAQGSARQGGAHANANRAHSGNRTANANRNVNHNRNTNVNRNVNRNTNVNRNVNRNVNVNRNWNGNTWGGARVAARPYAWPRGYAYARHPVGWVMPRPFLTSAYYYSAWATLGLTAPMAGYQWVRYGPDLLLVEIGTGRVVDVRYGVF